MDSAKLRVLNSVIARSVRLFSLHDHHSVTGLGGVPVETDAWDIDFVLTGSQKALALPPGLAFGVASERFIAQATRSVSRGLYFDLVEFEQYVHKHQTPNTPALSLLYATAAQCEHIAAETVLWAAGVAASPLAQSLGVPLDRVGRATPAPTLA